jgi:hypothetical protein
MYPLGVRLLFILALAACSGSGSGDKPTGTTADPVEVCERIADVCRFEGSKLGVCIEAPADKRPERCAAGEPCFVCQSQH